MKNNILRWILFLPLAILVVIVLNKLMVYFNEFSMLRIGYSHTSLFSKFYNSVILGIINGCVFVYIGTKIAPKLQNYVAWFLAILINFMFIRESVLANNFSFFSILFLVAVFISSIFTVLRIVNSDDDELENKWI